MTVEQIEQIRSRRAFTPLFARLAHAYLAADRVEEAKDICLSGVDIYPHYTTGYFTLTECYVRENNLDFALDTIQKALLYNPSSDTLLFVRDSILNILKNRISEPQPGSILGNRGEPADTTVQGSPQPDQDLSSSTDVSIDASEDESPAAPEGAHVTEILAPYHDEIPADIIDQENDTPQANLNAAEFTEPNADDIIQGKGYDEEPDRNILAGWDAADKHPDEPTAENPSATAVAVPEMIADAAEIWAGKKTDSGSSAAETIESDGNVKAGTENNFPDSIPQADGPEYQTGRLTGTEGETETGIVSGEHQLPGADAVLPQPDRKDEQAADFRPAPPVEEYAESQEGDLDSNLHKEEGRIVSKTLAEIFVQQGEFSEAILTYTLLKELRPALSREIDNRISELQKMMEPKL